MERKTIRGFIKADAILTGDFHLLENNPVCRLDDLTETQWGKLDFISDLQKKHDCPVIHSGDLYDYWKPSPMLLSKTIEHLPNKFWTIYGNHDLPQHNLDLSYKCGLYTLEKAGKIQGISCMGGWGLSPKFWKGYEIPEFKNRTFFVWHVMTYQGELPYPGCEDTDAKKLLKKYPQYDLIVTGHNHKPFVETYEGRLLVNPGSIFRLSADQIDHKPRVYLWYAETNTVTPVYIPIEKNVISREHLEIKKERDERIDAFISTLNTNWKARTSFEDNIEIFKKKNKVRESVMKIIYESLDVN